MRATSPPRSRRSTWCCRPGRRPTRSSSGCDAADFAEFTAGNIALIQRGTCFFRDKVDNALAAGASAAIIFNEGQEGRTDLIFGTLDPPQAAIPVLDATFEVGNELAGLAAQPGGLVAHVVTDVHVEQRTTTNVIADSPSGRTDRTVMVGAHLDSVDEGPGINDNGSGTATILETAVQMAELGIEPRNAVRFAFWGAEESGLIGSQHYVDSLTGKQLHKIAVYLNFDMVGSPELRPLRLRRRRVGVRRQGAERQQARREDLRRLLRLAGAGVRADRVRRALGLRRIHQRGRPLRWPLHRRRRYQDGRAGGDLRRDGGGRLRPVLPPGLRHHRQPVSDGARPDVRRHRARHADLCDDRVRH